MKKFVWSLSVLCLVINGTVYASVHEHHVSSVIQSDEIQTSGIIKNIEIENGIISVFHDPIPELKWPSMRMEFKVQQNEILSALKKGERIKFSFVRQSNENMIIKIEK